MSLFPISVRENWLRAVEFRHPHWIPCSVGFSLLTWKTYGRDLERIILDHPRLFPEYREGSHDFGAQMPPVYRQGEHYRDNWGCLWYNIQEGLEGIVVESPLADWRKLADYRMPDPLVDNERGEEKKNWEQVRRDCRQRRQQDLLVVGSGERLFDRLYFLRGFKNLMIDLAEGPLELDRLIEMLEEYETRLIDQWLEIGVDGIAFHTDIGTQQDLMISPESFRRHLKPMFTRLFQRCRQAGAHVYLSSDGCLLKIVDDLIECGVSAHDPQLRANTLEGIRRAYRGRLCAFVDLDRQSFPFSTPQQVRQQVHEVVDSMALPEGGLGITAGFFGGREIPLQTIAALCAALEECCFW